jgi:hypothetical protein
VQFIASTATEIDLQVTDNNGNTTIGNSANGTGGVENTALGYNALTSLSSGSHNTALGTQALTSMSSGSDNTAIGFQAAVQSGGSDNVAVGSEAACGTGSGSVSNSIAIGYSASINASNSIAIGCNTATANNSGSIVISTLFDASDTTGAGTYIGGIFGATVDVSTGVPVVIDTYNMMGTIVSSKKYKQDITDMGDYSNDIYNLRPVTFSYIKDPKKTTTVGLIAEEVQKSMPSLYVADKTGDALTVKYLDLIPMLLNEIQKLNARVKVLEAK